MGPSSRRRIRPIKGRWKKGGMGTAPRVHTKQVEFMKRFERVPMREDKRRGFTRKKQQVSDVLLSGPSKGRGREELQGEGPQRPINFWEETRREKPAKGEKGASQRAERLRSELPSNRN